MSQHTSHAPPNGRTEFLVDGCPRCREYVDDLGIPFDPVRFRAFWEKMIRVEWLNSEVYASEYDRELGTSLYKISLCFQRAYGMHPRDLIDHFTLTSQGLAWALGIEPQTMKETP